MRDTLAYRAAPARRPPNVTPTDAFSQRLLRSKPQNRCSPPLIDRTSAPAPAVASYHSQRSGAARPRPEGPSALRRAWNRKAQP